MRSPFIIASRYLTASFLCLSLSGCQLLYVAQLETARRLKPTDTIPTTAAELENCQVNQPCDRTLPLQVENWITDPWLFVDAGELPPGLTLSVHPIPDELSDYTIKLEGTPTEAGTYTFQIYLECCMTMSGPAQKARSEDITVSVTQ